MMGRGLRGMALGQRSPSGKGSKQRSRKKLLYLHRRPFALPLYIEDKGPVHVVYVRSYELVSTVDCASRCGSN
ncbi:hypothetical protein DsansV1_C01g0002641 [Dioscorea sansibarensis]